MSNDVITNEHPTYSKLIALWEVCEKWRDEQHVNCSETIYQRDNVVLNSYELIENIMDVIGYHDCSGEED